MQSSREQTLKASSISKTATKTTSDKVFKQIKTRRVLHGSFFHLPPWQCFLQSKSLTLAIKPILATTSRLTCSLGIQLTRGRSIASSTLFNRIRKGPTQSKALLRTTVTEAKISRANQERQRATLRANQSSK
jgi:hypothetical protein